MAQSKAKLRFDEAGTLSANLSLFKDQLAQDDTILGSIMATHLEPLLDGSAGKESILDELLGALTKRAVSKGQDEDPVAGQSGDGHAAPAAAPPSIPQAPVTPSPPPITGWLLEGISIEGFRGINNEGSPLSLDFALDKINSVSAQNGVGKSSIYDALRYAITGRLKWLDDLPAAERPSDYYLNRFHSGSKGTIELRLVGEPGGQKATITVQRDAAGTRTTSAVRGVDADAVLSALDREFVLLDAPTFHDFIAATPLERGRAFAGLLGLSEYSKLRMALQALSNTKAFNTHFETTARDQSRLRWQRTKEDLEQSIAKDYAELVGEPLTPGTSQDEAQGRCHSALAQITVLGPHCAKRSFAELKIDECVEAIKAAEGGQDRQRLTDCIREQSALAEANHSVPTDTDAEALLTSVRARGEALSATEGDEFFALYQQAQAILASGNWADETVCPLCDQQAPHSVHEVVSQKLDSYANLTAKTEDAATSWNANGWSNLLPLEVILIQAGEPAQLAQMKAAGEAGTLVSQQVESLMTWVTTLRVRARTAADRLAAERGEIEKRLPASLVQVTSYVETARRLQADWIKLKSASDTLEAETKRRTAVGRIKTFLDGACTTFADAESAMAKSRLAAVEPVCKEFFDKLAFFGVVPAVAKKAGSEELTIRLAEFFNLKDQSPQAILSESFRNAFAISLYLAAALLYGGIPKFIVLDDVTSSFDAGHQTFLVELLRTSFGRPAVPTGPQVIILSHDTMLEKLFNKHVGSGEWKHQRLEGTPQTAILQQAGAVNKVEAETLRMLQAGRTDDAAPRVRQYLEYKLNEIITKLRISVPIDVAYGENKKLAGDYLSAIAAAVKLHSAANSLVLDPTQVTSLNTNMTTIVANYLSHWETGQTQAFSSHSLLGVMRAIDAYADSFKFEPTPGAPKQYYRSLSSKA